MESVKYHLKTIITLLFLLLVVGFFTSVFLSSTSSTISFTREKDSQLEPLKNTPVIPKVPDAQNDNRSLPGNSLEVPILMYHHVGHLPDSADALRKGLTVSPETFEEQVAWLKSQGYASLTLEESYKATQGLYTLPKKPIVFSFDDGYQDVFTYAVPVLKKYGYVGSFAIISDFVGSGEYAPWSELQKAQDLGMEIVSHTANHFDGSNLKYSEDFIFQNLTKSKADIKHNLGTDTQILIYPYGHYTQEYIKQAKLAGFKMALTVKYGKVINSEDLYRVPRVRVHGQGSLERFKKNLLLQKTS